MGTIAVGRRRRGRAVRAAVALAAAVVVMDLAESPLGRIRAAMVGLLARPFADRLAARHPGAAPELPRDAAERRDRARAALFPADPSGAPRAPILSFDPLRHSAVVPVGSGSLAPGAAVTDGASLVGYVARVEFGLARVRLLGDRGLAVAAEVEAPGAPVRFTLAAGGGRALRIRYATDLDGVPAGARVRTAPIPSPAAAGLLVGETAATNGGPVADSVIPAADPALLAHVAIAGLEASAAPDPLRAYDRIAGRVVAPDDASPFRRSFLVVAGEPLPPRSVVASRGVVLGRVAGASAESVARVLRGEDAEFSIDAFVVPDGGGPRARVRLRGGAASGVARVESISGAADAAARGATLVTAPDDGLVPPGLLVGTIAPVGRLEPGGRVAVSFDGADLATSGAVVEAYRLRSPLRAEDDEESSP